MGLIEWARGIHTQRNTRKVQLTRQLKQLLEVDKNNDNLSSLIDTKIMLNWEIENDKVYWEQRAKANWLKVGDKSTSVFLEL